MNEICRAMGLKKKSLIEYMNKPIFEKKDDSEYVCDQFASDIPIPSNFSTERIVCFNSELDMSLH